MVGVTAFIVAGSGAQSWTGMNSPDSEFSASLVIFGHEVTDRAIDPAYYWTRLGFLAPMRGLSSLLGFWTAWEVWRALLLLLAVGSIYWIAHRRANRLVATAIGLTVALNTMLLGYLGNPYATGTAMSAMLALLATGVATLDSQRRGWPATAAAGALVAWLIMINPYAALLGAVLWMGLRAVALTIPQPQRWRQLAIDAGAAVTGALVVFLLFLGAGLLIFPGDNWFATYRDWNARLDYGSFISDPMIWTKDAALAVIGIALIVAVIALIARPSRWTGAAVAVVTLNIVFALGYMQLIPGPWLEAPHYSAMLWPAALAAITMALAAFATDEPAPNALWLALVPLAALLVWSGHRGDQMTANHVLIATAIAVAAVLAMAALTRGQGHPARSTIAVIAAIAVIGVCAQFLQNGRGWLGIYGQYPMNAAFTDYGAERLLRSKIAAQEFVMANTTAEDRIGIWTDPDRMTAAIAAMQLWGIYNNVSANPVLDRREVNNLERLRPTVIAMYAPDRQQIDQFAASLPPWSRPDSPECTTVPYEGIGSPEAHVCLVRLRWVG